MIEHKIAISPHKLMEQAYKTAGDYMSEAQASIDKLFGEGYAREHAELIAAFMKTAATEFTASIIAQNMQYLAEAITAVAENLQE